MKHEMVYMHISGMVYLYQRNIKCQAKFLHFLCLTKL